MSQMDALVRKRASIKGAVTRIQTSLTQPEITKFELEVRLKNLDEQWKKFQEIQQSIEDTCSSDEEVAAQEPERAAFETRYYQLYADIKDAMDSLSQISRPVQNVKLPRLDLPQFTGNYEDWLSFRDLFVAAIHQNSALTDAQRLQYLKSSLKGEAASLIRSFAVTDANYDEAWTVLKNRYNNERYIIQSHLDTLFGQKTLLQESAADLRKLLETTVESIRSLQVLGQETEYWDTLLVYLVSSKLDPESRRNWELEAPKDSLPTFEMLTNFIEGRCRAFEAIMSGKGNQQSKSVRFMNSQPKSPIIGCHLSNSTFSCPVCNEPHQPFSCPQFLKLPVHERSVVARQKSLCFNCLREGHSVTDCRSSSCKQCKGRHHTLLHRSSQTRREDTHTPPQSQSSNTLVKTVHPADPNLVSGHVAHNLSNEQVLLSTALLKITDVSGSQQLCRALIDGGSQASFISSSCIERLGIKRRHARVSVSGLSGCSAGTTTGVVNLHIASHTGEFTLEISAFILQKLTKMLPSKPIEPNNWNHLKTLIIADPMFHQPSEMDIILGVDVIADLLIDGLIKGPEGAPLCQNSKLGWLLSGRINSPSDVGPQLEINSNHGYVELDDTLRRFWELETITEAKRFTYEERQTEQHFADTHYRNTAGRYVVQLPFQKNLKNLGNTRKAAVQRLLQVERKLEARPTLKQRYHEFMKEYLEMGHMEEVDVTQKQTSENQCCYLPHHGVEKEASSTTKLRVVFDGSLKSTSGVSLNQQLMVGPTIQRDLVSILLRFRLHRIGFSADIAKMYRQIEMNPAHRSFQRILWRDDVKQPIKEYQLTTVTYGTASAPYLATKVLQQLSSDEGDRFPQAATVIKNDFFMDDCMSGGPDDQSALELQQQLIQLTNAGGFQLRKWSSNSSRILTAVPEEDREYQLPLEITNEEVVKALGLWWNPATDEFRFTVLLPPEADAITKRRLLADVARIFDPLGWLAPTIIIAKVMFQQLWLRKLAWDESLPKDIQSTWTKYRAELPLLQEIKINRWVGFKPGEAYQLHLFCDASQIAYAAAAYLRVTSGSHTFVHLILAKTKVAPIKQVSLPRLELCSAHLLSELFVKIKEALPLKNIATYAWSDSTIALSWISAPSSRWTTFVANRVAKIQEELPARHWRHVCSLDNPADCATRGVSAKELSTHPLWWSGPQWLKEDETQWPKTMIKDTSIEEKPLHIYHAQPEEEFDLLSRFSSLTKLKRVTAFCIRFYENLKNKEKNQQAPRLKKTNLLTSKDLKDAFIRLTRFAQKTSFYQELEDLGEQKSVSAKSRLRMLYPFLDSNGLIRVGGRIKKSDVPYDQKHPIVLAGDSYLAKLVVQHAHEENLHAGALLLTTTIQQDFWILGLRNLTRQTVHKCVTCYRERAKAIPQLMGDLPSSRLKPARPFLKSGIDYAGPLSVKISRLRGRQRIDKGYIAVFVCMVTKAIHLEFVSSLTSQAFIAAFRRFTARRGRCAELYSDCGTNFVGADKELQNLLRQSCLPEQSDEVNQFLANNGTTWHFNPPGAPHFGGLWEAGVKSTKSHLRRVTANALLTFEEFTTLLTQIEACLNSRPLCALPGSPDDPQVLTPGHFLVGEPLTAVPEPDITTINSNRLSQWQRIQQLTQHFWKRWSQEYLSRLQQRPKWSTSQPGVKVNDIVLLKDEQLPPTRWNMARIVETHPGSDGITRVVTVKHNYKTYKKPIMKVCPLPISDNLNN